MTGNSSDRAGMVDLHDRGYAMLLPAARRAMFGYAAALRRRLGQSAWGLGRPVRDRALVAAGPVAGPAGSGFGDSDAEQLLAILSPAGNEWPQILSNSFMPTLSGWLGRIPLADDHPAVVTAAGAWRSEWLEQRTQVLLGVPDEVTAQLRTELTRLAAERGTDVRDAKAAAQSMLSDGYPMWNNRAQLIARTEVVSANNQGMLASWRALAGTLGGGGTVTKTWIGGTRPTHSAVSGSTLGIDEKFQVGASEMDGPGDGAGGAGEVANCKCSLSFEVLTTPDTAAPALVEDEEGAEAALPGPAAGEETASAAEDAALERPDYLAATDDELASFLSDAATAGDEDEIDRILAELDRRDGAAGAEQHTGMSAEEHAQDAEYHRLISEGRSAEDAFEQVYGAGKEASRTGEVITQLRSEGYTGRNFDELTQAVFKEEAERMYWLAEQQTNGYLLNKTAERAGIDPRSLFTGQEARARKYASDELLGFWQQYTRVTVDDIRAGMLGGTMRSAGTAAWA